MTWALALGEYSDRETWEEGRELARRKRTHEPAVSPNHVFFELAVFGTQRHIESPSNEIPHLILGEHAVHFAHELENPRNCCRIAQDLGVTALESVHEARLAPRIRH